MRAFQSPGSKLALLTLAGLSFLLARRKSIIPMSLTGRVVAITGGSRGLGLILARQLAAAGAQIAICARDPDELQEACIDLLERGAIRVLAVTCDVARRDDVRQFLKRVVEDLGPVDILINNAGIILVGPRESMGETDYRREMDVLFWGMVHSTEEVLPEMIRARHGRIINITSFGGTVAVPHLLPYCAAKFAAVGYSQGLQAEVARHGVRVTTVIPGLMMTGSSIQARFKGQRRKEFNWFSLGARLPLLSMNAEHAARKIIAASRTGRPVLTLGMPAKIGRLFNALFPNGCATLLAWVNRGLPDPTTSLSPARNQPGWRLGTGDENSFRFHEIRSG